MNLHSFFDSRWHSIGLGLALVVLGGLRGMVRPQSDLSKWTGRVIFIPLGLYFLYKGIHGIHGRY